MKSIVLSSVIAVVLSSPEPSPEADPYYAQYQWPGAFGVGPYGGFSSTCYGCRSHGHFLGKRSAEADPGIIHIPGIAAHPYHGTSYVGRTVFGYPRYGKRSAEEVDAAPGYGKRSAEPEPHGIGAPLHPVGIAGHPGHATSFVGRTIFGYPSLHYGKRSAEPEPHGVGIAAHPGHATSYVGPTVFGYPRFHYGKRSAEADPGYGHRRFGFGHHGYSHNYGYGYGRGHYYGKREAEADPHYGLYGYGGYAYGVPGSYTHVSGLARHGFGFYG